MSIRTINRVCATAMAMLSLILFRSAHADDSKWRIISAGVFGSLDKSNLKCEFSYRRGIAFSPEDAAAGKFVGNDDLPSTGEIANGLLVKQGDNVRYRLVYETPTDFGVRGRSSFSSASFDFGGGKSVLISYYLRQRNLDNEMVGGSGTVFFERRMESWYNLRTFASDVEYCPLFIPLELPGVLQNEGVTSPKLRTSTILEESEANLRFEIQNDEAEFMFVDVGIGGKYPVVKKVQGKYRLVDFSDFVNLASEHSFAKNVTTVIGPYNRTSPRPFWIGHLWQATTVTDQVAEDDFNIAFEGKELKRTPLKIVNVAELSKPNVSNPVFDNVAVAEPDSIENPPSPNATTVQNEFGYMPAVYLLIVIVVAGVTYRTVRKKNCGLLFLSLMVFLAICARPSVCEAQASDVTGGGWVQMGYWLQPDGSLMQSQQTMDRRGVTTIEFSLRSELLLTDFLKLKVADTRGVTKLLEEYDAAFRDPAQGFAFDSRSNDREVFLIESPRWQNKWRTKLEEVLDQETIERLDQATVRWFIGCLGFESFINLHVRVQTPFLALTNEQLREIHSRLSDWRKNVAEQNQDAHAKHLANVVKVLSAGQAAVYEREYASYLDAQRPPIEFLLAQLKLSKASDLVKQKLVKNVEAPDAWLSLPTAFTLGINGELLFSTDYISTPGAQKFKLLEDLQMSDFMELGSNQWEEITALQGVFTQRVQQADNEFNRKLHEALKLNGIDYDGYNPHPGPKEVKIYREHMEELRKIHQRLDQQLSRDIDQVLVPKQIAFLEILATRSELRVFGLLNSLSMGRLGTELKLSSSQKETLERLREREVRELKDQAAKMEKEVLDKWTEVFTPKQLEEWNKLVGPNHEFYQPIPNLLLIRSSGY